MWRWKKRGEMLMWSMLWRATAGGCPNPQPVGSSVIIFTTRGNCPMTFLFKYTSCWRDSTMKERERVCNFWKLPDGNGRWVDHHHGCYRQDHWHWQDLLMLHSVHFEDWGGWWTMDNQAIAGVPMFTTITLRLVWLLCGYINDFPRPR